MLHGAAKLAKENARKRARQRRIGLIAVSAATLILFALAILSHWWNFGVVWSSQRTIAAGPVHTVRTISLSKWKYRYVSEEMSSTGMTAVPVQWKVSRAGPLWNPPPGSMRLTRNNTNLSFWIPQVPFFIAFFVLMDKEARAQQRARRGCCSACGYNLKGIEAIDNQTTCPECGTIRKHRPKSGKVVQESLANNA